ncbi:unnamed protein product [Prunus brigantina]
MRVRQVLEAVLGSRWWTFVNVRESQISSWAKKPRREEKPIDIAAYRDSPIFHQNDKALIDMVVAEELGFLSDNQRPKEFISTFARYDLLEKDRSMISISQKYSNYVDDASFLRITSIVWV